MSERLSHRELLKKTFLAGVWVVLTGCQVENRRVKEPLKLPKEPQATPDETQKMVEAIHREVVRLTKTHPKDSLVQKVYLGKLAEVSPVFKDPLKIGIADPKVAYARTFFGKAQYSQEKRFRYFLKRDSSVADYKTLESIEISVFFSSLWLNSQSEAVKSLALEKEAVTIAQWEGFSRIALNTYLSQGRIEKIDPKVKEEEIAWTLARNLLIENPEVRKLYDYGGYLPILAKVGELLEQNEERISLELAYSNLSIIYLKAKKEDIPFADLSFGSREFYNLAFSPNSPWVKMILEPSIPGPVIRS